MGTLNVANLNLTGNTLTSSANLNLTGSWTDAPAGTVIQMASASSGPARQTITSASPTTITGLSIDFTPRRANSKILISAFVSSSVILMLHPFLAYFKMVLQQHLLLDMVPILMVLI